MVFVANSTDRRLFVSRSETQEELTGTILFEWGNGGAGASELAKVILEEILESEPDPVTWQSFKRDFITNCQSDKLLEINEDEIRAWLEDREQDQQDEYEEPLKEKTNRRKTWRDEEVQSDGRW